MTGGDRPTATLYEGSRAWHDGPGWYYVDDEYPEDGSCGAFTTRAMAIDHAHRSGYAVNGVDDQ